MQESGFRSALADKCCFRKFDPEILKIEISTSNSCFCTLLLIQKLSRKMLGFRIMISYIVSICQPDGAIGTICSVVEHI